MLNSYLTDSCMIVEQTKDEWGTVQSESLVETRCRHEACNRLIRDYKGDEILSSGSVSFGAKVSIIPGRFIELGGRRYQVIRVDELKDFSVRGLKAWLA